jgi:hypothetical protein
LVKPALAGVFVPFIFCEKPPPKELPIIGWPLLKPEKTSAFQVVAVTREAV